jgi:hypothetical protein
MRYGIEQDDVKNILVVTFDQGNACLLPKKSLLIDTHITTYTCAVILLGCHMYHFENAQLKTTQFGVKTLDLFPIVDQPFCLNSRCLFL